MLISSISYGIVLRGIAIGAISFGAICKTGPNVPRVPHMFVGSSRMFGDRALRDKRRPFTHLQQGGRGGGGSSSSNGGFPVPPPAPKDEDPDQALLGVMNKDGYNVKAPPPGSDPFGDSKVKKKKGGGGDDDDDDDMPSLGDAMKSAKGKKRGSSSFSAPSPPPPLPSTSEYIGLQGGILGNL